MAANTVALDLSEKYRQSILENIRLLNSLTFALSQIECDNFSGAYRTLVEACFVWDGEVN